ncbi:MAG: outer membrane beta-barrel family protein [Flavobacteriaceae bacterium]
MKKLVTLCILIASLGSFAQPSAENISTQTDNYSENIGTVEGLVIDAKLNQPLPYVTVIIENNAGETLTGGITDNDGNFRVNSLAEGTYNVKIQYIGFKPYTKEIEISKSSPTVNLGTIALEEDIASLNEVVVVAEISTIQQKVDRKVINVGKDLTTAGPTASDIMNNLPSVSVDEQSGALSFRGNENVTVMVDGKISSVPVAQLLKQIPSNAIKQIELITNPSAKYNPEGMSGIINIILHKNVTVGFNGSIDVGLAYEVEPKFNSSLNMNYRTGKFNFYGNLSNNISKNDNFGSFLRIDDNIEQEFDLLFGRKSQLYKVGLDVYINEKNTLSIFTNQNIYDGKIFGDTFIKNLNVPSLDINQKFDAVEDNYSQQYNLSYKLEFEKEDHTLELEADHNIFESESQNNNTFFGNINRPNYLEETNSDREQSVINLDYVNPLSETAKLELGAEARLFNSITDYFSDARSQNSEGLYIPSSTNYDFTRDIYSAYATFGNKLEKWTYQIGVRAESVEEKGIALETDLTTNTQNTLSFDSDYFEIYPSAFITYSPTEKGTYQMSYSRRVDRPNPGQLNPLPEWTTPLASSFGNPNLQPQFTNSIEANYTRQLEKGSITGGVFYRLIKDEINQFMFIDRADLNRIILSNGNFDNSTAYGVEASANIRPTKWWSINASADLFSRTQKSIAERLTVPASEATLDDIVSENVTVENVAFNGRLFNNFKVSDKLSFSAFGLYRSPQDGIQFNSKAMGMVNLGMRYNFIENGTFSLNVNDIFDTMKAQFTGERPYRQEGNWNWESQTVFVGINYRFGGGKYRALSRKQREANEAEGGGGFF